MAIPDNLTKCVISGTLAGGKEIWNSAFWISGFTSGTFPSGGFLPGTVPTPWTDWFNAIVNLNAASMTILGVDGYFYQGGVAVKHEHSDVSYVGVGSTALPPQSAIVMTLRTALATRSGRGRMYLPITKTTAVDANGAGSSSLVNTLVDKTAALMSFWNVSPNNAVVVSQTNSSSSVITSVDADVIVDTQRRRRNNLTATRHSHSAA